MTGAYLLKSYVPIIQALAPYNMLQVAGGSSGLSLATLFMVAIIVANIFSNWKSNLEGALCTYEDLCVHIMYACLLSVLKHAFIFIFNNYKLHIVKREEFISDNRYLSPISYKVSIPVEEF